MTSGGNNFSDFPKNQLHSRHKIASDKKWGAQKHGEPWTLKSGGSSLRALQKFTPMPAGLIEQGYCGHMTQPIVKQDETEYGKW